MANARHQAPARAPRLVPRRADAVVLLAGAAMLAIAAIGASAGPPSTTAPDQVALATTDVVTNSESTAEELADLRQQRGAALLQASRATDRSAIEAAPPPPVAPAPPVLPATTTAYTAITVNLRAAATEESAVLAVLEAGTEIAVTDQTAGGYVAIVYDGAVAWVYAEYVAATPPESSAGGVSGEPCASGSGVESGLTSNAVAVHRAVCALFPGVSAYGGLRPGDSGEHGSGRALDIMISTDLGNEIAAYLQVHAAELGVTELIWRQRIWTTDRASDDWRWMEDRGSATANHYDHVHVTVS